MSWSFKACGTVDQLRKALAAKPEKISKNPDDYCRKEFEEAAPRIGAILDLQVAEPPNTPQRLAIEASGSASTQNGRCVYKSCLVSIKQAVSFYDNVD